MKPCNTGQLTALEWSNYANEFQLKLSRGVGIREDDVIDFPLARMPERIRTQLVRRENFQQQGRKLRVSGVVGLDLEVIRKVITQLLGGATAEGTFTLVPHAEEVQVQLQREEQVDRLLEKSGALLTNGRAIIFSKIRGKLTLQERFQYALEELKILEQSGNYARVCGSAPRRARFGDREWGEEWDTNINNVETRMYTPSQTGPAPETQRESPKKMESNTKAAPRPTSPSPMERRGRPRERDHSNDSRTSPNRGSTGGRSTSSKSDWRNLGQGSQTPPRSPRGGTNQKGSPGICSICKEGEH